MFTPTLCVYVPIILDDVGFFVFVFSFFTRDAHLRLKITSSLLVRDVWQNEGSHKSLHFKSKQVCLFVDLV